MRIFNQICIIIICLSLHTMVIGQLNMPTTIEGIGNKRIQAPNVASSALGLVTADAVPMGINYMNPASYSRLKQASFDVGLTIDNTNYTFEPSQLTNNFSKISISNIHIGMPIKKGKIGLVIGMYPFTEIGYNLVYKTPILGSTSDDSTFNAVSGNGGSHILHAGLGFQLFKYLNIGFNIGYLWGTKHTEESIIPTGSGVNSNYLSSLRKIDLFFGSFYTTLGGTIKIPVQKHVISLGATFSTPLFETSAKTDGLYGNVYNSNPSAIIDTIRRYDASKVDLSLPSSFKLGLGYSSKTNHFHVGIQYKQTNWKAFSTNFDAGSQLYQLDNSWSFALGLSYRPLKDVEFSSSENSYFRYVTYQFGAYFGQGRLLEIENGNHMREYGASIGALLPLKKRNYTYQSGNISLSLKYGLQGTPSTNIFSSKVFTIQIGFVLGDIWFLKRKFD